MCIDLGKRACLRVTGEKPPGRTHSRLGIGVAQACEIGMGTLTCCFLLFRCWSDLEGGTELPGRSGGITLGSEYEV